MKIKWMTVLLLLMSGMAYADLDAWKDSNIGEQWKKQNEPDVPYVYAVNDEPERAVDTNVIERFNEQNQADQDRRDLKDLEKAVEDEHPFVPYTER